MQTTFCTINKRNVTGMWYFKPLPRPINVSYPSREELRPSAEVQLLSQLRSAQSASMRNWKLIICMTQCYKIPFHPGEHWWNGTEAIGVGNYVSKLSKTKWKPPISNQTDCMYTLSVKISTARIFMNHFRIHTGERGYVKQVVHWELPQAQHTSTADHFSAFG